MQIRKALIPAAGWGTRFLPATKAQPKEMLPLIDKPAIQYIVEEAVASGIEDIIIVTGKNKRAIEDHFDRSPELEDFLSRKGKEDLLSLVEQAGDLADIHYIRQKEQLGLGHAVFCARKFIGNEPFAVLLGDDIIAAEVPCLKQMVDLYDQVGGTVIAVQEIEPSETERYGIVQPGAFQDGAWRVEDLVEKPPVEEAPSNLAVVGRYIIQPQIFKILAGIPPGAGGEIQLTDALRVLAAREKVYAYQFQGTRYDVGEKLGYLQATVEMALRREDLRDTFGEYLLEKIRPYLARKHSI